MSKSKNITTKTSSAALNKLDFNSAPQNNIIRLKQLIAKTGLSRSTIYAKLNPDSPQYDPTFPKPINLSTRSMGFLEREAEAWIASKIEARDQAKGA